jgi:peptidoglycan/LPS O-acetylase OafA/YrhL
MEASRSRIGFIGIAVGAVALLTALVHFWMGPISPQPSVETTVAEKAVAIKNATIAALKGEKAEEKVAPRSIDPDQAVRNATSVLGGLALILGVVSFAKREPLRVGGGAAFLGGAAIAFQFAVVALGAIVLAILIGAVISQIGIE